MVRLHRSILKRARKVDADNVANRAEDYISAFCVYKRYLENVKGLVGLSRLKNAVKKIDDLEMEILKTEDRLERLKQRRAIEAAKLEENLSLNLSVVQEYLEPDEFAEFRK